jgi:hypothetical protein
MITITPNQATEISRLAGKHGPCSLRAVGDGRIVVSLERGWSTTRILLAKDGRVLIATNGAT